MRTQDTSEYIPAFSARVWHEADACRRVKRNVADAEQTSTTLPRPPPWSMVNLSTSTEIHLYGLLIQFLEPLIASRSQHSSQPVWLLSCLPLPPSGSLPPT